MYKIAGNPLIIALALITLAACILAGCAPAASDNTSANTASDNKSVIPAKVVASAPAQPVAAAPVQAPRNNAPGIQIFTANPALINENGISTLTWDVSNATSISISPGLGPVNNSGTIVVYPATSTTYRLTASNPYGSATASASVFVALRKSYMLPVVVSLSAHPLILSEGETCTLAWNVFYANSIEMSSGASRMAPQGTLTVNPTASTAYTITATNYSGSVAEAINVTVLTTMDIPVEQSPDPYAVRTVKAATVMPIINRFYASPNTVLQGNSSVIYWDGISQASLITLNGEQVGPSGNRRIYPGGGATYTLTASNSFGTSTAVESVYVLPYNASYFKPLVQ